MNIIGNRELKRVISIILSIMLIFTTVPVLAEEQLPGTDGVIYINVLEKLEENFANADKITITLIGSDNTEYTGTASESWHVSGYKFTNLKYPETYTIHYEIDDQYTLDPDVHIGVDNFRIIENNMKYYLEDDIEMTLMMMVKLSKDADKTIPVVVEEVIETGGTINLTDNVTGYTDNDGNPKVFEGEQPTITDITQDGMVDVDTPGEYKGTVKIVYPDGSEEEVTVPIIVKKPATQTDAEKYDPKGQDINVKVNETPNAEDGISNKSDLPQGTTYNFKGTVDTATPGEKEATIIVTYPDKSTDEVIIKVMVTEEEQEQSGEPIVDDIHQGDKVITGEGEPGSTITVTIPGVDKPIETIVDKDGNWTVDIPTDAPVEKGDKITVTQTEDGKNESKPVIKTVLGEETPEPGQSATPTINKLVEGDKVVNGTGVPGATIKVTLPDGTVKNAEVNKDGKWTVATDKPLKKGEEVKAVQLVQRLKESKPASRIVVAKSTYVKPIYHGGSTVVKKDDKVEPVKPVTKELFHFAYVNGYPNGTFRPNGNITRGEVAMIFARLSVEGMNVPAVYTDKYSDVNGEQWYADAISYMSTKGVLTGYPDGSFKPEAPITRAELAAIVTRYNDAVGTGQAIVFSDVLDSHWASENIARASQNSWITGYPDGTFKPDQAITRAETVTMTNKMLDRFADESFVNSNTALLNNYTDISGHWAFFQIHEASNSHYYVRNNDNSETWKRIEK